MAVHENGVGFVFAPDKLNKEQAEKVSEQVNLTKRVNSASEIEVILEYLKNEKEELIEKLRESKKLDILIELSSINNHIKELEKRLKEIKEC